MKTNTIALGGISIIIATAVASAVVIGIQSVAADATSTASMDTDPVEQPADAGTQAATTSDSTAPTASTTTETAPEAATSTPPAPPSQDAQATKPAPETVTAEVSALQEAYYEKTGSYLQVMRGNGLPSYESGAVSEKLGKDISTDAWVHVYEAPAGKGYQVLYEADGVLHSVGYGSEAGERTFSRSAIVAPSAASTTP
jgi:cytoskeletal protein RodZ